MIFVARTVYIDTRSLYPHKNSRYNLNVGFVFLNCNLFTTGISIFRQKLLNTEIKTQARQKRYNENSLFIANEILKIDPLDERKSWDSFILIEIPHLLDF